MGTSMSSAGSSGSSPLVPAWAAPDGNEVPSSGEQRFRSFRTHLGKAAVGGGRPSLERALGHYARSALGGASTGTTRFNPSTTAGSSLWGALSRFSAGERGNVGGVDLGALAGRPVNEVIGTITKALTPANGDGDRIRAAMEEALANALEGVEFFEEAAVTEDVIFSTLVEYLTLAVFSHIMSESGDAFDKPADPAHAMQAENDLRELVKAVVETQGAGMQAALRHPWSAEHAKSVQDALVRQVLADWEGYEP